MQRCVSEVLVGEGDVKKGERCFPARWERWGRVNCCHSNVCIFFRFRMGMGRFCLLLDGQKECFLVEKL